MLHSSHLPVQMAQRASDLIASEASPLLDLEPPLWTDMGGTCPSFDLGTDLLENGRPLPTRGSVELAEKLDSPIRSQAGGRRRGVSLEICTVSIFTFTSELHNLLSKTHFSLC